MLDRRLLEAAPVRQISSEAVNVTNDDHVYFIVLDHLDQFDEVVALDLLKRGITVDAKKRARAVVGYGVMGKS